MNFLDIQKLFCPTLSDYERKQYQAILEGTASEVAYQKSLRFLSDILYNYYQKNVIVLIDEYDSPIHIAFDNGYYKEMINFMRSLLSEVLKDNPISSKGNFNRYFKSCKRKYLFRS